MNILITGATQFNQNQLDAIKDMGHVLFWQQQEKDELVCNPEIIDCVICNGLFLHHDISQFNHLKYIQLTSAGYDRVPMDYISEHGIKIQNAKGVYSIPMAEFIFAGVLQIYKQMQQFNENQKNALWEKNREIVELNGKTVCVIGCGDVGTECAKRFQAFGCQVIGIARKNVQNAFYDEIKLTEALNEILPQVDIVILSVPLTKDTEKMIGMKQLALMKDGAILVNVSRGNVVDEDALVQALQTRPIYGVLDVFETEPLDQGHPLWKLDNVVLTPHNSFTSDKNLNRLFQLTYGQLKQWSVENEEQ